MSKIEIENHPATVEPAACGNVHLSPQSSLEQEIQNGELERNTEN